MQRQLKVIGPNGGYLVSKDGEVSVQIPPEALTTEKAITLESASNVPAGCIGIAFKFGPADMTFHKPVTISIKYTPESLPGGVIESNLRIGRMENNKWQNVYGSSVDTESKVVTAVTTQFSTYGIVVALTTSLN